MAYPTPEQTGIRIPPQVKEREFLQGFEWALQGGHITRGPWLLLGGKFWCTNSTLVLYCENGKKQ
jgi:hypothetical protein